MEAYYGGQIKEEYRGNLAAVVTKEDGEYGVFAPSMDDEDFIHLTGIRATRHSPERVYMGINIGAVKEITNRVLEEKKGPDFFSIDFKIVHSPFVGKRLAVKSSDRK